MRIFVSFFASFVLTLSGAHSAMAKGHLTKADGTKSHASHKTAYIKPGAAVSLTHDYDGKTRVGEFETLTAKLSHIYQDGTVSVELLAPDNLHISGFSPLQNIPIYSDSSLELPIQFSGRAAGDFTMSLQVVHKSPLGHESRRVLSIAVNIGGETSGKVADNPNAEFMSVSRQGVIGLSAIEVIE